MTILLKYLRLLFPHSLEQDEYIRLFFMKAENANIHMVKFVKSFEDVYELVMKYRIHFHCFISLSSYKGLNPKDIKSMAPYRRSVIFLDFDQKDFTQFNSVADYSLQIKEKIPLLYNHAIVASGSGGYHFYIACETSYSTDIVNLNKRIATLVNADIKATSSTQIARIPTSYNLKNNQRNSVIVVNNEIDKANFKPYKLETLLALTERTEQKVSKEKTVPAKSAAKTIDSIKGDCYCVKKMLAEGVVKGERNFALGRIVEWFKSRKYTYSVSKSEIMEWNTRCSPPKNESELISEFEIYWKNDKYQLLGCNLPDGRNKEILNKYCDKTLCDRYHSYIDNTSSEKSISLNSKYFNKINLGRLSAYHYIILFMLNKSKPRKVSDIVNLLSRFISERTINAKIKDLDKYKLIVNNNSNLLLKKINSKYNQTLFFPMSILILFLKKKISAPQLKVYLALKSLLQMKSNVTLDTLSEYLKLTPSTISEHLNNLKRKGIIDINTVVNDKGLLCNHYSFNNISI